MYIITTLVSAGTSIRAFAVCKLADVSYFQFTLLSVRLTVWFTGRVPYTAKNVSPSSLAPS